jgi:hypothetical protein
MPMANVLSLHTINLITFATVVIVLFSAVQGIRRGASGSMRQLLVLVTEGMVTVLSILLAWRLTGWLSPALRDWLVSRSIQIPQRELGGGEQLYYTFVTALRDFSLMRSGVLFLLGYMIVKHLLSMLVFLLTDKYLWHTLRPRTKQPGWTSSAAGAAFGTLTGLARALMMIAGLFVITTLFPNSPFTGYVQASGVYRTGATQLIQPFTGEFLKQLPVFTRSVEAEFNGILQRKYEVLDARVPNDVAEAAKEVTAKAGTDEEKARALYKWVGTRVAYDWDKVEQYETKRVWKEQTPEDTFLTRKGVCIDYSRLYAVMARSVGLEVKVVTGLGYDGRGGYGPHAWNEVYLSERKTWVPLDSTWVSSGGNWFNPPNFYDTHIKDS